jgi:hypothetical protein
MLMFLGDLCLIPNIILSYFLGKYVCRANMYNFYWYFYLIGLGIYISAYSL